MKRVKVLLSLSYKQSKSISRGRDYNSTAQCIQIKEHGQSETKELYYAHYHLFVGQNGRLARLVFVNAFGLCTVFSCIHFLIWGLPVVSAERKSCKNYSHENWHQLLTWADFGWL
jgi:hypothetical protein